MLPRSDSHLTCSSGNVLRKLKTILLTEIAMIYNGRSLRKTLNVAVKKSTLNFSAQKIPEKIGQLKPEKEIRISACLSW